MMESLRLADLITGLSGRCVCARDYTQRYQAQFSQSLKPPSVKRCVKCSNKPHQFTRIRRNVLKAVKQQGLFFNKALQMKSNEEQEVFTFSIYLICARSRGVQTYPQVAGAASDVHSSKVVARISKHFRESYCTVAFFQPLPHFFITGLSDRCEGSNTYDHLRVG